MNSTIDRYCENTLIINNKEYKLEKIWRRSKNDTTRDAKGELFPYPKEGPPYSYPEKEDITNRLHVINTYLDAKKKFEEYEEPIDCHLCDKKGVSTRRYMYASMMWEDGLIHYIHTHNVKLTVQFKQFILSSNDVKKIFSLSAKTTLQKIDNKHNIHDSRQTRQNGRATEKLNNIVLSKIIRDNKEYVVMERNQILILDALMIHGGYEKRYIDVVKNLHRYSEHAGFLDFEENMLSKIVVSGRTNRVDEGDNEIYLPMGMEDMFDYEYIYHTHPPTPRPGGRADEGILYEFPSIGDIYHFIDHHNGGVVIGSLVVTAEGLYNIRKFNNDGKGIHINEDLLYKNYQKIFNRAQKGAINEYGTGFNTQTFYANIAQNTKYIDMMNKVLNGFNIHIDFYPRKKDPDGRWVIDTIFLIFRENKSGKIKEKSKSKSKNEQYR